MSTAAPTILVVDDDSVVLAYTRALLEQHGYQVQTASDGAAATLSLKTKPVDAVLIDILMPKKEGLETIIELKREYPELIILAMSASGASRGHDFLTVAAKFGADGTLQKPFTPEQLLSFLKAHVVAPALS